MNWLQSQTNVNPDTHTDVNPDINEKVDKIDISRWDARYPRAGNVVSGLNVASGSIPNTESISASMNKWDELPGIREVPLSDFGSAKPDDNFYALNDFQRSKRLTEEIRDSRSITPLIVVIDHEGPYLLEGLHRFVALGELGVRSFPALVVIDLDVEGVDYYK